VAQGVDPEFKPQYEKKKKLRRVINVVNEGHSLLADISGAIFSESV
jgi:hypothetical protein